MRRKAIAKADGLPDSYDVGTYPSAETTITRRGSWIKPALLTAAAIAAGGAGAWWLLAGQKATEAAVEKIYDVAVEMEVIPPAGTQ